MIVAECNGTVMKSKLCIFIIVSTNLIVNLAFGQSAKIVGIGSASCEQFILEVSKTPTSERDYFHWAQGFMSGALIRAPTGVDEGIDLIPKEFPLERQINLINNFCKNNVDKDYMDAAHALYRRLRDIVVE